jgi:hypothetical protein
MATATQYLYTMDKLTKFRIAMEMVRTMAAIIAVSINAFVIIHIITTPK